MILSLNTFHLQLIKRETFLSNQLVTNQHSLMPFDIAEQLNVVINLTPNLKLLIFFNKRTKIYNIY